MTAYPHLFSPLQIGSVTVRNRIMQTAHVKLFAYNAVDSERNVAYQAARAKGGAGLLITGNRVVHPTSTTGFPRVAWAYLPEALEADRRLTAAVHEHGAVDLRPAQPLRPQRVERLRRRLPRPLGPVGREVARVRRDAEGDGARGHPRGRRLVGPLRRAHPRGRLRRHRGAHLAQLPAAPVPVAALQQARRRVRRLVREPAPLRARGDRGGAARAPATTGSSACASASPTSSRARSTSRTRCGSRRLLEADGRIDYVNVTAAGYHNIFKAIEPSDVPDGYLVDLTAQVKAAVDLPVFTVGGIKDAALAEEILAAGKADMVAMTRAQIADPEFANKVREGREDEIVHCIRGNQGCIGRVFKGLPIACTVNPGAGRERRFGPGTLVRRRIAGALARRRRRPGRDEGGRSRSPSAGIDVTLLEREERLGGQVNLILRTPGRDEFGWITRDLESPARPARRRRPARHGGDGRARARARAGRRHRRHRRGAVAHRLLERQPARRASCPGVDQDNVLTVWDVLLESRADRQARRRARRRRHRATPPGSPRCCSTAAREVELVSRWPTLFPAHADHARHGPPVRAPARQGPRVPR